MPINVECAARFSSERIIEWDPQEVALFALATGGASDPGDERQARLARLPSPLALPTFAAVLARNAAPNVSELGGDYSRSVLAAQDLVLHNQIAPKGRCLARGRIAGIEDRGAERGALVAIETSLFDGDSGEPLATATALVLARADGGNGGFGTVARWDNHPGGSPLGQHRVSTRPDQALLYSLLGDTNPLHTDAAHARELGYQGPLLHGLCTWSIAARVVIDTYGEGRPDRLLAHRARLTAPVIPGDSLRIDTWPSELGVAFEVHSETRSVRVIANGWSTLSSANGDAR